MSTLRRNAPLSSRKRVAKWLPICRPPDAGSASGSALPYSWAKNSRTFDIRVAHMNVWRAGYYRDQTFMWATRMSNVREFFAQLYGNADPEAEPASGGRQMGNHFATRFLDDSGAFLRSVDMPNSSADVSNVAGWMPRLVGLAYASKLYRENPQLKAAADGFSVNGDEVAFGTIGDAATSEGLFWEAINAAGVLQIPMAMS